MVVGIHAENVDPVEDGSRDIAVEIAEQTDGDCEERGGFDKFPGADEDEGDRRGFFVFGQPPIMLGCPRSMERF